MHICFATNNQNKLLEIREKVPKDIQLLSLSDIGCHEELPETGNTLEANALQKARYVSDNYKISCFADDTGLEVEALGGEPGVDSAHYAGPARDSEQNMALLLQKMEGEGNRHARFRTVISLILDGQEHAFEGVAKGEITPARRGAKGFGYDPIFKPLGFDVTFAEMTMQEKNKISHRAKAVERLVKFLQGIRGASSDKIGKIK